MLMLLTLASCARESAQGRPWIHSIELRGVTQVSPRQLKKKIAISPTRWWLPFAPKKYLDPFAVDDDKRRIEAFYRAHGFFDAKVEKAEVIQRKGGKSVDVRMEIKEGQPTRYDQVQLADDDPRTRRIGIERLELKSGQVFDHGRYLAQKNVIEGALKAQGHPWAQVEGQVLVDRRAREADVTLESQPGPWARIRMLHIRGTSRINPALVSRLVDLESGKPFNLEIVERARSRAYALGVFSSVRATYEKVPGQPDQVDVVLNVQESTLNELRLGGGFGIEQYRTEVRLQARYRRRDFLGGLRMLDVRLAPAYVAVPAFWDMQRHGPAATAEVTLTQPAISFLSQIRTTVGYDVGIEYGYQYHGPRAMIALARFFWRERVQLALAYNFNFLDFFNTDPAILQDPTQAGRVYGYVDPYRVAWLQQDVVLDLRDSALDARRGFYLGLSAEEGGVYTGSAFTYEKLLADARGYIPMGKRVTTALRVQFGHLFPHGDLGSPITRRFYMGGANSHRGFNYNRLSPQIPAGVGSLALPIGADEALLAQVELRINIVPIAGNWLAAALFWDAGDVAQVIDVAKLHHAVGGGLRLKTVIGTIRADVGVRLNRVGDFEPDRTPNPDPHQRVAFHISLGEAF
jgi:outer membrane protein assembly factor BamA